MTSFRLTVTMLDGSTSTVETRPSDLIDLEDEFDKGVPELLGPQMRVKYLWWMAWNVLRRDGEKMPFDVWRTTVADVAIQEADAAPLGDGAGTASPPA